MGCRERVEPGPADAPELVRLAWDGDASVVVADVRRRAPGRGGWIHPRRSCVDQALKKRALNRALRRRVNDVQLAELLERLLTRSTA